jgi:hypothetical protein
MGQCLTFATVNKIIDLTVFRLTTQLIYIHSVVSLGTVTVIKLYFS